MSCEVALEPRYASSITYAANNHVNSLPLGNTLTETTTFNTRFQPTGITVGSPLILTFVYGTGTNGTVGDNGNLQSQTIAVPTLTNAQSYMYDGVNRLSTFTEKRRRAPGIYLRQWPRRPRLWEPLDQQRHLHSVLHTDTAKQQLHQQPVVAWDQWL